MAIVRSYGRAREAEDRDIGARRALQVDRGHSADGGLTKLASIQDSCISVQGRPLLLCRRLGLIIHLGRLRPRAHLPPKARLMRSNRLKPQPHPWHDGPLQVLIPRLDDRRRSVISRYLPYMRPSPDRLFRPLMNMRTSNDRHRLNIRRQTSRSIRYTQSIGRSGRKLGVEFQAGDIDGVSVDTNARDEDVLTFGDRREGNGRGTRLGVCGCFVCSLWWWKPGGVGGSSLSVLQLLWRWRSLSVLESEVELKRSEEEDARNSVTA